MPNPVSSSKRREIAKQNLEKIFENFPDPIFVTDSQGNVLLSNSSTALTLDMSLDQLLKSNVADLVKKGYYTKSYAMEVAEKKCVLSGILKTKLNLSMISASTPVLDDNGEVILVVTHARPKDTVEKYISKEERGKQDQRKREIEYLRSHVLETDTIVAESKAMRQVLLAAHAVAQTDSTVLLNGESGTGKEVLAKYIHRHSKRFNEAFIAVNCAAFPEQLVESELFGYERGAFTGAKGEGRMGLIEAAHNGTLFLDEIAELPLTLQSKLLRVLETGEVRRLGSNTARKIDFRLIAATHQDLKKMSEEYLFREDLYYRLNVIPIRIPPLRDRPEDTLVLALKFLDDFNRKHKTAYEFDGETLEMFQSNAWPGNVRELRNAVERKVIQHLQDYQADCLQAVSSFSSGISRSDCIKILGLTGSLKDVTRTVEEKYIDHVLRECGGRIGEAAKRLGIYRTVLYRKLKAFERERGQA
ncbi:sigma-54 interaction domain-containing protein [Anaeroselena agilis]|uniref:Sigma 54-interacting transcriptional regulator n=1 Tax=Anaeroselena agilis TaxID=3063788 RepID=A0ABU3NUB0_9FIRM|nr:sigma 54-interacting transcriptional regulator [Selenomonadales bacterium 4137-cl]